ncbi:MAG: NRDE family protein [Balneolales bacterium]
MCTVSFFPKNHHDWLLSTNRDEMKSREKALPPIIHKSGSFNYLAPVDGKAGGTWIGLNTAGIGLTIMNNYQGANPLLSHREEALSRGLIIPELMHFDNLKDVDRSMQDLKVSQFNPFVLIGIQSNPWRIMQWSWDGLDYTFNTLPVKPHLWISTGRAYEGVWKNRKEVFDNFLKMHPGPDVNNVKILHSSNYPVPGAYSISMEQDMVATVSNTIAEVSGGNLKMHYHDGKPVESGVWEVKEFS